MSHWIIHSTDLFKTLIPSGTKQVTFFISESLNHSQTFSSITLINSEWSCCLYKWVVESFVQPICSKTLIYSGMKQVTVFEWIIESFTNSFFKNTDLFNNKWLVLWVNRQCNRFCSETNQVCIFVLILHACKSEINAYIEFTLSKPLSTVYTV